MNTVELVFIPTPLIGHLTSAVQLAHLLVNRHPLLSITILIIKVPFPTKSAPLIQSLCSSSATDRIRFITLPEKPIPDDTKKTLLLKHLVQSQKLNVANAVANLAAAPDSPTLGGFVVDMFCIPMLDVANQFAVPTFVFYTSSASFLALLFHLQELYDGDFNHDMDQLLNSATASTVPGFSNPIPEKVISNIFFDRDANKWILENTRRFREARGILVNTFSELESDVMKWFSNVGGSGRFPSVYAVGPILNLGKRSEIRESGEEILKWLDSQPPSSVVFLCFGSSGSFNESQTKEIAYALERTGVRFLWSIRQDPSESGLLLPEGFVDRTAEVGRITGWAPQVEILEHPATGGFVSHCGWNSVLESLWNGVPVAAWPMYAEQSFNAFEMVVELGLATEVSLDYSMKEAGAEEGLVLAATEIEAAIRKLMEGRSDEIKRAVGVKREECKKAMMEGGSSYTALNRFMDAIVANTNFK